MTGEKYVPPETNQNYDAYDHNFRETVQSQIKNLKNSIVFSKYPI